MTAAPMAAFPRVPSMWRRLMVGGGSRWLMAFPGIGRRANGGGYPGYSIPSARGLQALTEGRLLLTFYPSVHILG